VALAVTAPYRRLRGYVRRYYGFREETGRRTRRREGPGVDVVVLLSLDREWRMGSATDPSPALSTHTSLVAGLRDSAVLTEHDGSSYAMQVNLTPPGAFALFRLPMSELAGDFAPTETILDPRAPGLLERLAALGTWPERFALLDTTFAGLAADAVQPSREVV
jgi:hypothetical protein